MCSSLYKYYNKNLFSFALTLGIIFCSLPRDSVSISATEESLSDILLSDICAASRPGTENVKEVFLQNQIKLLCARLKSEAVQKSQPTKTDDIVGHFLPKNYDKQMAPRLYKESVADNGSTIHISRPATVYTYLNIRSVREVDEAEEQITLDMDIQLVWVDGNIWEHLISQNRSSRTEKPFVEEHFIPVPAALMDKLWHPDVFIQEVASVGRPKVLDKLGQILYFNPNLGAFFLRSRMLISLYCAMNFEYYPSDTQKCPFHIRSDSHYSSELGMKWWRDKGYGVFLLETSDPNFDYQITSIKEFTRPLELGPETHHSRPNDFLWFEIAIRRKMSFHLLQTYLPSIFFLTVTWLCFFIPRRMFEARVGVAMTTLLTQTSLFSSIRESTPVVGYVKAIDTWMVTCILFIFFALFAFTTGAWVRHEREKMRRAMAERAAAGGNTNEDPTKKKRSKLVHIRFDMHLERYTVFLLSFGFATFGITYWTWLLVGSDYLNWNVNSTWNDVEGKYVL